jgi:hypothetical protein
MKRGEQNNTQAAKDSRQTKTGFVNIVITLYWDLIFWFADFLYFFFFRISILLPRLISDSKNALMPRMSSFYGCMVSEGGMDGCEGFPSDCSPCPCRGPCGRCGPAW